jgi:hypothetical protein
VGNATQRNKIAYETITAPTRGAFSKTLLDGLRTIRDANQQLTIPSLEAYVKDNIAAATANDQRPYFIADPNDPPPVVVAGPQIPTPQLTAPIRIATGTLAVGTFVQLANDRGETVGAPVAITAAGTTIPAVPEGFYALDLVGTTITQAFRHVAPGGTDVAF